MRGAQFSATLSDEKCSELQAEQASLRVPGQGGFAPVLAALLYHSCGRDYLQGSEVSEVCCLALWRYSSISPLETSGTLQALKGAVTRVLHGTRGIRRVSALLSSICIRCGFGFKRNHRKPRRINGQFWSSMGTIDFLQRCVFSAQHDLNTDFW